MTPNRGPVHRCSVRGCVFVGYWPEDGRCPVHSDPFAQPTPVTEID